MKGLWRMAVSLTLVSALGFACARPKEDRMPDLKKQLSPLQYHVTQEEGTEPPFQNEYWDNKKEGIYVEVVSGEPLFSSLDKFDSGTGWPSFTRPLESANIVERSDRKLLGERTEVRSKRGDSHLGHLFDDGPAPTRLRYCVNSAALRFIPVEKMQEAGYGAYMHLFSTDPKVMTKTKETATFAAGCFWGVQEILRGLPGVLESVVGYTGGHTPSPTYEMVKKGTTGHAEAVQVMFDPARITYEGLLGYFFRLHDPTTRNRQGNDVGTQYRSTIFYHGDRQREIALRVKKQLAESGKWDGEIVTEIVPAGPFYPAEDYHQDYLKKNPGGYTCHYLRD